MNVDESDSLTIDDDDFEDDADIAAFEKAEESSSKKVMRKLAKRRCLIREKLYALNEKIYLDRQLNTLSDYWDL
ncbi:hypothetical protein [Colwellia echini]|uniref:Uncharacterized protein n=1 Tax=Colwellia echini TaxID=1982103 RepID=A0ABY3MTJ6_9GAMM|nr:hypothetical protein [Colwellia echini]TYK64504.1 hypothetical protein CWS31_015145 [Colwellia echini]